jgi:FdrA protein
MNSVVVNRVKRNFYQDSLRLMQLSRRLGQLSGVIKASAIMATEANLRMLREARMLSGELGNLTANDLLVTIEAQTEETANQAIETLDSLATAREDAAGRTLEFETLDAAALTLQKPNLVVVSVPGLYAKIEVIKAIEKGLHTFLFSDNVTIEEEVELKQRAAARGLLVMGPECGTAIINGVGLGFANVVRRGPVGIVAAAGTGLQEVASLIHAWGSGVSHAIGVGGRDLSKNVGGIMALRSIRLLLDDASTRVVVLISKPPDEEVAQAIVNALLMGDKPAVICFVGKQLQTPAAERLHFCATLEESARKALDLLGNANGAFRHAYGVNWKTSAQRLAAALGHEQRYVRGLFSGGTLCYEAQFVLLPYVGRVYSNAPLHKADRLDDVRHSREHSLIDMGHEAFTRGRPHPMIDSTERAHRIIQEAEDPGTAVILLDVVLGYVAASDPAGDLLPAINEAKSRAKRAGRNLAFVAHVCGTNEDPQSLRIQKRKLKDAGILVLPSNALATRTAGWIATRGQVDTVKAEYQSRSARHARR